MNRWTWLFLWLGGGAFAMLISSQMNPQEVGYVLFGLGGIAAWVIGFRTFFKAAETRSASPAVTHVPIFKRKRVPAVKPPVVDRDAEAARLNAFFADVTNTAAFGVAQYFAQERITHKEFMPFARKYMPQQKGIPFRGSGFQIAAGLIGTSVTAGQAGYLQGFLMNAVPNFRVERTLFSMSEQEREIYSHMSLLRLCGGIATDVYRRFERAVVFNGGNCVLVLTHEPHQYSGVAEQVLKEFLAARLMPPGQNTHFAIQIFNQVKQAIAAEKAHQALPAGVQRLPNPSNLAEIEKILDDI